MDSTERQAVGDRLSIIKSQFYNIQAEFRLLNQIIATALFHISEIEKRLYPDANKDDPTA